MSTENGRHTVLSIKTVTDLSALDRRPVLGAKLVFVQRLQFGQRGDLRRALIVAIFGDARKTEGETRTVLRATLNFIVGHFHDDLRTDAHCVAVVVDLQGS